MAICDDCNQEMNTAASCVVEYLLIGGHPFRRRPSRPPRSVRNSNCGDCGVMAGGWHHFGCDMEECPSCGWQLLSCSCGCAHLPYDDDGYGVDDGIDDEPERAVYPLLPRLAFR